MKFLKTQEREKKDTSAMVKSIMDVVLCCSDQGLYEGWVIETWIGYGRPLQNGTEWSKRKENEQNVHSVVFSGQKGQYLIHF